MKIKKIVIALVVILVFICGFSAGYFTLFSNRNDTLRSYNDKYQEYTKQKSELILSDYSNDENSDDVDEYNELANKYTSALSDLNDAFKSKDVGACKQADSDLSSITENLKSNDKSILNAKSDEIKSKSKENTFEFTVSSGTNKTSINDDIEEFNTLFKDRKYNSAYTKYIEIKNRIDNITTNVSGLPILRYDYDYSEESPKVRVYIDTDKFENQLNIDSLDASKFRIYEFSDGALNELDSLYKKADEGNLSVDLVADVSGSMQDKFENVRDKTRIFAEKLTKQNNNVGLISFSDYSYRKISFTNNFNDIASKINELQSTNNMTALYDALHKSLMEISTQNSAKCVLAFTDGANNYGNYSKDYIKQLAKNYHIPIYIIGLGNELGKFENELKDIADYTNGGYYSSEQSNLDEIYNNILQNQGKLSYVEFTDKTPSNNDRKLYIEYNDGQNTYYTDFSDDLSQLYIDGECAKEENKKSQVVDFVDETNKLYFDVIQYSSSNDANAKLLKARYEDGAKDISDPNELIDLAGIINYRTNLNFNKRSKFSVSPIMVESIETGKDENGNSIYTVKYHQYYEQSKPEKYTDKEWSLSDGEIWGANEKSRYYKGTEIETIVEKNGQFYLRYVDSSKTPENITNNMPAAYNSDSKQ